MTTSDSEELNPTARQDEHNTIFSLLVHYKVYGGKGLDIVLPPAPVAQCIRLTDPATPRGVMIAAATRLMELSDPTGRAGRHGGRLPPRGGLGRSVRPLDAGQGAQGRPSLGHGALSRLFRE